MLVAETDKLRAFSSLSQSLKLFRIPNLWFHAVVLVVIVVVYCSLEP
jgi:hypothetical protein